MPSVPVTMPQLGETVAEGTVTRWLIEVGGEVRANEPLLEVSTDKVDTEVASPVDGVLASVAVAEDETVPVGTVLATVDTGAAGGDAVPDTDRTEYGAENATPVAPTAAASASVPPDGLRDSDRTEYGVHGDAAVPTALGTGPSAQDGRAPRHRDSPRVRRHARERGVDLARLIRTGRHGRATVEDVENAAQRGAPSEPPAAEAAAPAPRAGAAPSPLVAAEPAPPKGRTETLSRRRKVIADRMVSSLRVAAQLTTVVEVDLTRVSRAREKACEEFRRRYEVPLTVLAFVAEAAVRALAEHPVVNARLDVESGTVTYPAEVHLGIAVDTPEGLMVPVVHRAHDLSVGGLARRISGLAARSRDGSITADELSGGTFTITNTGSRGALFDTPILNQPESAILGLGAMVRRPVVMTGPDGEELLSIRSMAYLALTYDHRLIDGADAARFLGSVRGRLERLDGPRPELSL